MKGEPMDELMDVTVQRPVLEPSDHVDGVRTHDRGVRPVDGLLQRRRDQGRASSSQLG